MRSHCKTRTGEEYIKKSSMIKVVKSKKYCNFVNFVDRKNIEICSGQMVFPKLFILFSIKQNPFFANKIP